MGINSQEVAYGFGQHGSGHMKSATDLYAPTGKVIVAITMLENIKFENTNGLVADTSFYTGTQVLPNGEDDDGDAVTSTAIVDTVEFPKGVTIYGRWTRVALSTGYTHGIIVYYGPE